jgi:glycosyltransferase involved in cell wall biosynthesis
MPPIKERLALITNDIQTEPPTRPARAAWPAVTALLPAYNEAKNIAQVLKVLCEVVELGEIIVVDDGSADDTAAIVQAWAGQDPRVRLIRHPANRGKGEAVFTGANATRATFLLMVDSDLRGLSPGHIRELIRPVLEGQADMTLGLFRGGQWNTTLSHRLTPWLTGQRCFRTSLLRFVSVPAAAGYGVETALTIAARQRGYRTVKVPWPGVSHPPSEYHRGLLNGVNTRGRMYAQIIRAWYLASGSRQLIARLRQWLSVG